MINVHFPQPGGYYDWKDWASALVMALKDMQPQTQNADEAQTDTNTDLQQQIAAAAVDITQLETDLASTVTALNASRHGECQLTFVDTTTLRLVQQKLGYLIVNNVPEQVPAAGITLLATGLTTGLKYVYVWKNGANLQLEASATGYTRQANGVYTKTGDVTRTLVGMFYCVTAAVFDPDLVRSWFFDTGIALAAYLTANRTTTNTVTTGVEVNAEIRINALNWAGEVVTQILSQSVSNGTTGQVGVTLIATDGVGIAQTIARSHQHAAVGNNYSGGAITYVHTPSEGLHSYSMFIYTSGGTGTWVSGSRNLVLIRPRAAP